MEDVKIPGYVHLFKISIGGRLFVDEAEGNVYRFVASQGMNTSLAGLKKFINEIENSDLVKLNIKSNQNQSNTTKLLKNKVQLSQDIDVFIATQDLQDIEKASDAHFICYADSYMDSLDEFVSMLEFIST